MKECRCCPILVPLSTFSGGCSSIGPAGGTRSREMAATSTIGPCCIFVFTKQGDNQLERKCGTDVQAKLELTSKQSEMRWDWKCGWASILNACSNRNDLLLMVNSCRCRRRRRGEVYIILYQLPTQRELRRSVGYWSISDLLPTQKKRELRLSFGYWSINHHLLQEIMCTEFRAMQ
jgi:hypothetical protein